MPQRRAGEKLRRRVGRCREHLTVFVAGRDVPPTNAVCERALRPRGVLRKVTNGFRSEWMEANALDRDDVRPTCRRNAAILSVLRFVHPIILAVAPDGLSIVSDAFGVPVIAILDVVAKVAYGLMAVASDSKATQRGLAEPGRPASLQAAA